MCPQQDKHYCVAMGYCTLSLTLRSQRSGKWIINVTLRGQMKDFQNKYRPSKSME